MPKWAQILVSLVCLAVIASGAEYSIARERLRKADLHAWYQEINGRFFGGSLQDAEVCWGDLTKDDAEGMTYLFDDGTVRIEVDRRWVTSESKVREVLDHEACHVATEAAVQEQKSDPHGATFQNCMRRFRAKL
jgi:predicted SprT family Zn-dependent metalloprotease